MNSESKYLLQEEACDYNENQECDCNHPLGNNVIFKSNYSNFGPINVTFGNGSTIQTLNQPIASVTIDSSCLNCATIIIDFTGILNVTPTVPATSTLTFTLFKICNGFRRQHVTTVNFFVADITGDITASHTLAFKFPFKNDDCSECKDCCAYILELTSIANADFGTISYAINGIFSALAIGSAY